MPELFRSFGKSIKEFKKATSDVQEDIRTVMDSEEEPQKTSKHDSESTQTLPPEESGVHKEESNVHN